MNDDDIVYAAEDFQDLPLDVSKHAEALSAFSRMDLIPQSVRPALRARDLVFVRHKCGKFKIGIAKNPAAQEKVEKENDGIVFEVICQADNAAEAEKIRGDVERYFQRHFPGRTLSFERREDEASSGDYVYIALYRPS